MGFCRRCGDIVVGPRCKCGGTPTAPSVSFGSNTPEKHQDRWSSTYVSRDKDKSPTRTRPEPASCSTSATKRFSRPNFPTTPPTSHPLGGRVSAHIASSTSHFNRPPSPLKYSTVACPESDILPSLTSNPTGHLAKVYGSVLQSKESLDKHACSICHAAFPPDVTIYPEPLPDPSCPPRFLCRSCFTSNGGSKGVCPGCSRPVLALKAEGPFIEAASNYWHKKCFKCDGCQINIGDVPMLDLLGRPSCADCFENCLKRDRTPKKNCSSANSGTGTPDRKLGGLDHSRDNKIRESSPALEELEQRLGIQKSSPSLEELSHRLSMVGRNSRSGSPRAGSRYSVDSESPVRGSPSFRSSIAPDTTSPLFERTKRYSRSESIGKVRSDQSGSSSPIRPKSGSSSPAPTHEQIEEMKRRFVTPNPSLCDLPELAPKPSPSHPKRRSIRHTRSSGSLSDFPIDFFAPGSPDSPATPDLLSDVSDSTTQISPSGPVSPLQTHQDNSPVTPLHPSELVLRRTRTDSMNYANDDIIVEETNSQLNTPTQTPNSKSYVDSARSSAAHAKSPPTTASAVSPLRGSLTKRSQSIPISPPPQITSSSTCAKCRGVVLSVRHGGQYVTVPTEDGDAVQSYHTKCFTCAACHKPFREGSRGQSLFVKGPKGPCHVECCPPTPPRKASVSGSIPPIPPISPPSNVLKPSTSTSSNSSSSGTIRYSSRYSRPPTTTLVTTSSTSSSTRFGSLSSCPGCRRSVSPMERGVVPGPQGTRWHASCLVCGGKKTTNGFVARQERRKDGPGCGKKLDSAAKGDAEGGIWCRECWLMLPGYFRASPCGSPMRGPLVPTHTGSGKVTPQLTGTTTIARQFTGLGSGSGEVQLLRQLTGGGRSPTRSLSPTKQLGSGTRPRPKSVIGMRSSKSVDEGRGMFLVRQLTGSGP
ncbi:hypothetical protein E1B28_001204 [Marasmius oreades]|uniref:LIM zinc-binding domain-containing protein n=1 Tax=Marasmius oreades TaxID=181124 RepID=A0A9P7V336_9AGAR|nr:uncharacterized protein E1B28_001204 [Marasmius oreades]KAG7099348.1 hypothetical protein E1B28_001204 [Marasmius oreades]